MILVVRSYSSLASSRRSLAVRRLSSNRARSSLENRPSSGSAMSTVPSSPGSIVGPTGQQCTYARRYSCHGPECHCFSYTKPCTESIRLRRRLFPATVRLPHLFPRAPSHLKPPTPASLSWAIQPGCISLGLVCKFSPSSVLYVGHVETSWRWYGDLPRGLSGWSLFWPSPSDLQGRQRLRSQRRGCRSSASRRAWLLPLPVIG